MNLQLVPAPVSAKQLARAARPELVQVAAPTAADRGARWWPDLFLKKGRVLQAVSPQQLAALGDRYRAEALNDGRGSSDTPEIKIYGEDGKRIGFVAWNSRVFLKDIEGDVEVPV